jgi:hypothetical protein
MADTINRRLEAISKKYDAFIAGLPEPMKTLAESLSPTVAHGCKNPVQYYGAEESYPLLRFPLWVEDKYVSEGSLTGKEGYGIAAAAASLFGYLYIRVQDNVLDEPELFDPAYLLLGNELVREFFQIYHRLFPPDSTFWGYFRQYWIGTSNNTLLERQERGGRIKDFTSDDINNAGGKLDGAKISMAAMCILAGREDDIVLFGKSFDRINIASQLHNDAVSFMKDLKHDYFTCIIADAVGGSEAAFEKEEIIPNASLKALTGSYLEDWLEYSAVVNMDAVKVLGKDSLPGLERYVMAKNAHLSELKAEIMKIKKELLSI